MRGTLDTEGILSRISDGAALQAAVPHLPLPVAESIARKFVARNDHDIAGWETLVVCAERNGSTTEAVRLAELFLSRHARSPIARQVAAATFCNALAFDRAWQLLAENEGTLDLESTLRFGQLCLVKEPPRARAVFARILDAFPGILEAKLGLANATAVTADPERRKVGFLLVEDWHRPIQYPVFEACVGRRMPCFMTTSSWLVDAFSPAVIVISDLPKGKAPRMWRRLPATRIVHTRHGFGDKNYAFYAAGAADFVCVSSQAVADEYVANGVFPPERFWVTGYPALDPLFTRLKAEPRRAPGRVVLFAPTFTKDLSAGIDMGAAAVRAIRGVDTSISVIVRPHPHMREWNPEILQQWQLQTIHMPNVTYDEDTDLSELFVRADVLVSDVSSMALSYLALDRPIVCVDLGAEQRGSPYFAPDGIEWRMREAAEVCTMTQLADTIRRVLSDPKGKAAERSALRKYLFGDLTDGRAGRRIAKRISDLEKRRD